MKKQSGWRTKGMNRDLSVSAFNPEFAFENMNLRLSTNEGNTLMSWVNEKGTKPLEMKYAKEGRGASIVPASIEGTCIGTAVLNNFLVLFLTNRKGEEGPDAIYRFHYPPGSVHLQAVELFAGNLNFSVAHPIETLVSFEALDIQKVYWVDGVNQPRLINIAPVYNDEGAIIGEKEHKTNESILKVATCFDFIPALQLNEKVTVKKITGGGGMFAPGVIQYAFTYYYKYGQESNIFYTSPLIYISHIDRGAAPDDKVDNIFKITVSGIDTDFDYLRIYSIQRTSINATPVCKRIQDIALDGEPDTVSFTDTGTVGNSVDPMELQYKGGIPISANTMEQKDNTLFMGDITIQQNNLPPIGMGDVTIEPGTRTFYPVVMSSENYVYANQLTSYDSNTQENSVPCAGFKYGNKYRCGVQLQDELGRWSAPVWIKDVDVLNSEDKDIHPSTEVTSGSEDSGGGEEEYEDNDKDLKATVDFWFERNEAFDINPIANFILNDGTRLSVVLGNGLDVIDFNELGEGYKTFSNAVIRNGKLHTGKNFASEEEFASMGLSSNVIVTSKHYNITMKKMDENETISANEGHTYNIYCTAVEEKAVPDPDPDPVSSGINIRLHNLSNRDVYITGHQYISVLAVDGDWGPINIDFKSGVTTGGAGYLIPAGNTARFTSDELNISVDSDKPNEVVSKYYGGSIAYDGNGKPVYWRVYSWTSAHDPAVIVAEPGKSFNFSEGGIIDFNIVGVNDNEGIITPTSNPIDITYGVSPDLEEPIRGRSITTSSGDFVRAGSEEEPNTDNEESKGSSGTSSTGREIAITVPVLKGRISKETIGNLNLSEKYVKIRPVVVFPNPQDRKVICQGVANPTMYTKNHRGYTSWITDTSKQQPLKDLFAQSSWFFRPALPNYDYATDYQQDVNSPCSKNGYIDYQNNGIYTITGGVDNGADKIKRVEIQGYFEKQNRFEVDWKTLTYHSPDIEFDTSTHNLDYTSDSIRYSLVGNVEFTNTLSDIDIQTETPAISSKGSGFDKKSFMRDGSQGIISGLFWDDYAVDENREDSNATWFFERFADQKASAKWMVYLWNRKGSLNNDVERPSDGGVRSAVLKQKIVSNLRYATTNYLGSSTYKFTSQLFNSDTASFIKLLGVDSKYSNLYKGNVDTLLSPDDSDGMYFAIHHSVSLDPVWEQIVTEEIFKPAEFIDPVLYKTYAIYDSSNPSGENNLENCGIYQYVKTGNSSTPYKWEMDGSDFAKHLGDGYTDLVRAKTGVRMQYKSTPHLVMVQPSGEESVYSKLKTKDTLPVFELQRYFGEKEEDVIFGGISEDALKDNVWIPCGEPVRLDDWAKDDQGINKVDENGKQYVEFEYSWGDTYFQRWDCLKTYAFTPEDINQVVEIGSFMLESYVNIDGRYDRNRGQGSNLYMSPRNFNLLNPVYSQINNFFSYRRLDKDAYERKAYPNQITWSKTKTSGADVDLWTNVTLGSVMEVDGDKGPVNKLARFNDQLISFQDRGVSQILYNEQVQISTEQGVPIELANSGKVQGKRYLSDSIGCVNKWSVCSTPAGIYFMDSVDRNIYLFNGQLSNLSGALGMNSWVKRNIPATVIKWTPYKDKHFEDFSNFVTYNDRQNQDVLFINSDIALAYSEKLQTFTSFYDYGHTPYFCNFVNGGVWVRNEDREGIPMASLHGHQKGEYCNFFGKNRPYWMTLVSNPEPQLDKIFTNLEFRACVEGDGELDSETGKFTPTLPFDALETWNEYQRGLAYLSNKNGHSAMLHHTRDNEASLKRKFRIWRCDIPRDNGKELNIWSDAFDDTFLNPERRKHPNDRMRNPWLYVRLVKKAAEDEALKKTEIHDILMTYFT